MSAALDEDTPAYKMTPCGLKSFDITRLTYTRFNPVLFYALTSISIRFITAFARKLVPNVYELHIQILNDIVESEELGNIRLILLK